MQRSSSRLFWQQPRGAVLSGATCRPFTRRSLALCSAHSIWLSLTSCIQLHCHFPSHCNARGVAAPLAAVVVAEVAQHMVQEARLPGHCTGSTTGESLGGSGKLLPSAEELDMVGWEEAGGDGRVTGVLQPPSGEAAAWAPPARLGQRLIIRRGWCPERRQRQQRCLPPPPAGGCSPARLLCQLYFWQPERSIPEALPATAPGTAAAARAWASAAAGLGGSRRGRCQRCTGTSSC